MLSADSPDDIAQLELTGLAAYLVRDDLLDAATARAAIHAAAQQTTSLTSYLVKSAILSSQTILDYCVKHFGLPVFDLQNYDTTQLDNPAISPELIYRYRVLPLHRDQHCLHLGITDPTDHAMITALGFHSGLHIRPMLVAQAEVEKIINTHCRPHILESQLESALSKITPLDDPFSPQENPQQDDEPVIEFVDRLIQDAIDKHVSDIHVEPYEKQCRIRFRRDGLLYDAASLPSHLAARITTRLKIMADLNIAERRLPQDGRIQLQLNSTRPEKIDMRINTCPTLFGEKIVLRILDTKNIQLDINLLGLNENQKKIFFTALHQPQGLILVTGPTGSGKTVTLYSALHYLNQIEKNISSAEDPIEIELNGINQVNINPRIGLDFVTVLRTFLRQDPDVIMIGEIRDTDTANIAMQAAQTGHLVLSTLHTNSAAETITRLQSMGVIAYNLISSISLIIAQRLVRKLCAHCKQPEILPANWQQNAHRPTQIAYRAIGCEYCNHGYQGRIAIFELLPVTEKIAQLILSGANATQIIDQAKQEDVVLLWQAGLEKVHERITSYAELMRVVGK